MIQRSGQNWSLRASGYRPTISVIDRPAESYDAYAERKKREEGARRVPFGFSRVLVEQPADRSHRREARKR